MHRGWTVCVLAALGAGAAWLASGVSDARPEGMAPASVGAVGAPRAMPGPTRPADGPVVVACSGPAEVSRVEREPAPRLNPAEALALPGRDLPIERWKAAKYFCPGDFNRDDTIDDRDSEAFLRAWLDRADPLAEFLDINGDGWIDSDDFDAFFAVLGGSDCDPDEAAAYRSSIC